MKTTGTKGWTESQAYDRASLRQAQEQIYRSEFSSSMAFDLLWNEWVVVTYHPHAPITMHRKGRPGLRRGKTWREIERI